MTAEWTGDLTASYAYNKENRLTEVPTNHQGFIGTPGNLMDMGILYSYDSLGRRVSREEITDMQNGDYRDRFGSSGERMSYLYDGLSFNMLAEGRDASGIDTNGGWHSTTSRDFKPTSEYLRTNGRVITRSDVTTEGHSLLDSYYGGYLEKGYYTEDSLGSVMAITNSKGSITESYSYDSFGRLTEGSFDGINRLGYNGKRVDPVTGRSDYGFRDYSPSQMRFTTVDPIKSGSNWYSYVNNDPVNFIDPLGLEASDSVAVYAENPGVVFRSGWQNPDDQSTGMGWRTSINTEDGYYDQYGHLDPDSTLPAGTRVEAGDQIGTMADPSNGETTGPHVHRERRENDGTPVDPGETSPFEGDSTITSDFGDVDEGLRDDRPYSGVDHTPVY